MSKKGVIAGIVIAVVVIGFVLVYTNIFELAKPGIESSVDAGKEALSNVEGKDIVEGAEKATDQIRNATDKIEVKNPLDPKP